jgi:hypothetical protein
MKSKIIIILISFFISCGGGSKNELDPQLIVKRDIELVIVENNNFNEMLSAFEQAISFIENQVNVKFNITAIQEIEYLTDPEPWSGVDGLRRRGKIAFKRNPTKNFSLMIDKRFTGVWISGLADGICSRQSVLFIDTLDEANIALIAHELGHMLGMIHNDCEGCLMNTNETLSLNLFVSEENKNRFLSCRETLINVAGVQGDILCSFKGRVL